MKPNVKRIISQLVNNLNITRKNKSLDEDDSWYITFVNSSYQVTEIRISNHKTNINTWALRQYKTTQPTKRISIVFQDNDYSGTSRLNQPIKGKIVVFEYVYDLRDGRTLSDKEVSQLTKAIRLSENGSFTDPIGNAIFSKIVGTYISQNAITSNSDTVPATKWNYGADAVSESKNNESKTNKNMKQNTIKLNENQLRQVIAESVRKVLKEGNFKPQGEPTSFDSKYGSKVAKKYETAEWQSQYIDKWEKWAKLYAQRWAKLYDYDINQVMKAINTYVEDLRAHVKEHNTEFIYDLNLDVSPKRDAYDFVFSSDDCIRQLLGEI